MKSLFIALLMSLSLASVSQDVIVPIDFNYQDDNHRLQIVDPSRPTTDWLIYDNYGYESYPIQLEITRNAWDNNGDIIEYPTSYRGIRHVIRIHRPTVNNVNLNPPVININVNDDVDLFYDSDSNVWIPF